ncbi:hypothetical protein RRG08_004011 [Elysia crispata]|uniref:Uncharacterized protein n=1 Tax=Elysia crispata TaxID=231223 RepID=A0AAE0Y6Z8_9GAST|nr:hypothetical protein RRG08_004011 [Elysia crispata]
MFNIQQGTRSGLTYETMGLKGFARMLGGGRDCIGKRADLGDIGFERFRKDGTVWENEPGTFLGGGAPWEKNLLF